MKVHSPGLGGGVRLQNSLKNKIIVPVSILLIAAILIVSIAISWRFDAYSDQNFNRDAP
jgi:hypothetical protein